MKELKGTIIYSLSNLTVKFGGVIILPILTRLLTPEEYGVIGYIAPITLIFNTFIGGGVYAPLMKKYSDYKKDNNLDKFKSYSISFLLVILFLFLLLLLLLTIPFVKKEIISFIPNDIDYIYIYMSLFVAFFSALNSFYLSFFRIRDDYNIIATSSILGFIIQYLLTILLLFSTSFGVLSYFIGLFCGSFFVLLYLTKKYVKYLNFKFSFNKVKYGVKKGTPIIFIELGDRFAEISDRFILAKFLSLSNIGVYSLAVTGGKVIQILGTSYTNTLYSDLYENKAPEILAKKIEDFYLLLILIGLMVQLLSFNVVDFVFSSSYINLNNYFILLIPCSLIQYFYFLDFYFHANEKSKLIPVITFSVVILNLLINLFLIPIFGIYAAIFSTYFVFLFRLIVQVILIKKFFNIKFNLNKIVIIGSVLFVIPVINFIINLDSFLMERLIILIIVFSIFLFFSYNHFRSRY